MCLANNAIVNDDNCDKEKPSNQSGCNVEACPVNSILIIRKNDYEARLIGEK